MKTFTRFILQVLFILGIQPTAALVQEAGISLHISQVDVTIYPAITVHLSVWDESGLPLAGLAPENFTLQEDDDARFHPSTLFCKEGGK